MQQGAGTSCFPPIHFLATQELPLPLSIMAGGQRDPVMCLTFPCPAFLCEDDNETLIPISHVSVIFHILSALGQMATRAHTHE